MALHKNLKAMSTERLSGVVVEGAGSAAMPDSESRTAVLRHGHNRASAGEVLRAPFICVCVCVCGGGT